MRGRKGVIKRGRKMRISRTERGDGSRKVGEGGKRTISGGSESRKRKGRPRTELNNKRGG